VLFVVFVACSVDSILWHLSRLPHNFTLAMRASAYAAVVLNLPMDTVFHYRVPESLRGRIEPGHRVVVPFRDRRLEGICVALTDHPDFPPEKIKDLLDLVAPEPLMTPALIELTRWMASYYLCSWGEAIEAALPAPVKRRAVRRTIDVLDPTPTAESLADHRVTLIGKRQAMGRALDCLLAARGEPITIPDLCRRAHVTRGPVLRLLAEGLAVRRTIEAAPDQMAGDLPAASLAAPAELTPAQEQALAVFRAILPRWDRSLQGEGQADASLSLPPTLPLSHPPTLPLSHPPTLPLSHSPTRCLLLHGVTSSGKTEVYLRAIAEVIAAGRQAIVLVPEIALTPQTVARFRARFPRVAVLHSVLADRDRAAQWEDIRSGKVDVVVGARSALFAPVPRLGLIVVDEEHETGYKQESDPRYHAREASLRRAGIEGAAVILGSATPSLESHHAAIAGRFARAFLPERIGGYPLPPVEIVDLAGELRERHGYPVISRRLEREMRETLSRREQVLLFLNRRGFATMIHCPTCKWVLRCPRCAIALTYHKREGAAMCHYCYGTAPLPEACPECARPTPRVFGMGTQRVEETVRALFPEARAARMDSDAMRSRRDYREAFDALAAGAIDILVGTQMIAKGLDVPNVTLVGVVSADTAFWMPDFRSAERTFQLVLQVAGRAGRGPKGGHVVVQTFNPDHYSLVYAARHDYDGFAARELEERKALGYPPFTRLVRIVFQGTRIEKVRAAADRLKEDLAAALREDTGKLLGPVPAPLAHLKGRHRVQLLVKTENLDFVQHAMRKVRSLARSSRDVRIAVDVDPMGMM
jgi:primosomal protein N' (replication factor Y)